MLLAIDIGNTNISYGILDGADLKLHLRSASVASRTSDEYSVLVRQMLELRGVDPDKIDGAIVASVVPILTDTMVGLARTAFGCTPLVVGPGIKTGMPILYEDPREVGADRIVNAVAAYEWAQDAVIVVDFGTATTFDCISNAGEYLGGAIAPGIQISAEALFARASRLHRVDIVEPSQVVGRNTVSSMQSGIVFGYAGLVDGLCRRIQVELGHPCRVVGTGGYAPLIAEQSTSIERVDPNLTLDGLRIVYERNRLQQKRA
ncbi:MAG: type III pantothenate kinase [Deltaproteobacteria bacterium]|jgi:type III pantothenate kinase|nr:type III pantothenate kinase [Deltaproteobacteria bacterium]MBW2531572.1 type III pantothenate kinase [Deltaproteobacteria bacterium]